jgi:hypothetical protein
VCVCRGAAAVAGSGGVVDSGVDLAVARSDAGGTGAAGAVVDETRAAAWINTTDQRLTRSSYATRNASKRMHYLRSSQSTMCRVNQRL